MLFNKKGSLELSVNAIVILILAIGILGLGIGFVKTMFDRNVQKLDDINQQVEQRMIESLKQSSERLKVDPNDITIRQGGDYEIYLGLRNELDTTSTFAVHTENGAIETFKEQNPGLWRPGSGSVVTCFSTYDDTAKLLGKNDNTNSIFFEISVPRRSIQKGEIVVQKMVARVNGRAPLGGYECAMIIADPSQPNQEYARQDFFITVED